jgi:TRAP-type mannitol/chloroaromatic compound transport system permease large subunit
MTDPQLAMVMLGIMLIIIMLGFPIAFSLLALGLFFGFHSMEFRISWSRRPTRS